MKLYKGNLKPYLYAVFAPADAERAQSAMNSLAERDYLLYHATGAPDAGALKKAAAVLLFLSGAALADENVMATVNMAVANGTPLVVTYLEQVELPPSLAVPLGAVQGIFRERYESEQAYFEKLLSAEPLQNMRVTPAQKAGFRRVAAGLGLGAVAAVAAALLILNPFKKEEPAAAPAPVPTEEPVYVDPVLGDILGGYTEADLARIETLYLVGDIRYEDDNEIAHEDRDDERTWYYKGAQVERGTLSDLSLLAKMPRLREVVLQNQSITDISPLFTLPIQRLKIEDCPIASIEGIEQMHNLIQLDLGMTEVEDISPLEGLRSKAGIELGFYECPIRDYSPLQSFDSFGRLHLNVFDKRGNAYADTREILSMLAGKRVSRLDIYGPRQNVSIADIAQLVGVHGLSINNLTLNSLEELSQLSELNELEIGDMDDLRTLAGLENTNVRKLYVNGCGNLQDISALYGMPKLERLHINYPPDGVIPDFSRLTNLAEFKMSQVRGVRDVEGLKQMTKLTDLGLSMMPWLTDLSSLEELSLLFLRVSPNLEAPALALQEKKPFLNVEVDYSNWTEESIAEAMELHPASLAQLESLSDADLAYVVAYGMVGDAYYDPDAIEWVQDEWEDDERHFLLDGKRVEGKGTVSDLSFVEKMTGLRRLELLDQPLTSLEGIQKLTQLEQIRLDGCDITDASPLFAVPTLKRIHMNGCPIRSIQGVQNLFAPITLDFDSTRIDDISPLADCDFTQAYEEDGVQLSIGNTRVKDCAALSNIEWFCDLNVNGLDASLWLPHIQEARIERLSASWSNLTDVSEIANLEGLSELQIDGNKKLTDLSPLLTCETLERLCVSEDMQTAVDAIADKAHFEIEVW